MYLLLTARIETKRPVKPCSTWARRPNLTATRTEVDIHSAPYQLPERIFGYVCLVQGSHTGFSLVQSQALGVKFVYVYVYWFISGHYASALMISAQYMPVAFSRITYIVPLNSM
jgi:hypothetical protein